MRIAPTGGPFGPVPGNTSVGADLHVINPVGRYCYPLNLNRLALLHTGVDRCGNLRYQRAGQGHRRRQPGRVVHRALAAIIINVKDPADVFGIVARSHLGGDRRTPIVKARSNP